MKNVILLITILSMAVLSQLYCINHLDLMFMMQGTQVYGNFGTSLAALDFNGDGFDDLAVLQLGWVPDSLVNNTPLIRYGRILLYYGGLSFDMVPDFTIEGQYNWHLVTSAYSPSLVSVGDVNGDGYDDLGVRGHTDWTGGIPEDGRPYVAVYFGGQNPSTQPGYYKSFPSPHSGGGAEIDPLGDVNNDGIADFCYYYRPQSVFDEPSITAIILGGTFTEVIWRQYNNDDVSSLSPAGDANHDGYADYVCTYYLRLPNRDYSYSSTLYYGSQGVAPTDSLLLYSGLGMITLRCKYLGDINGDGKDDFCGLMMYPNMYVWYGDEALTSQPNLTLTPSWYGEGNIDRGLVYGDLNNDGYDDVIGSQPLSNGENGGFRLWLGGANMNGTSDLTIAGSHTGMLLGTGMAAGDFNGDGYCDVAASAPHSSTFDSTPGRVYIYSGNAQLADTTVSIEDDTAGLSLENWSFNVIPNPIYGKQNWKLKLTGKGYDKLSELTIKIYNPKGQRLKSFSFSKSQIKSGEVNLPNMNLPNGVYEISLYSKGSLLKTGKATIK